MRKALLLAYVLNRTLLLPPLLPQTELAFGPPEERCADRAALADLQRRAERIYTQQAASGRYEPLMWAYEFGELQRLGMRVAVRSTSGRGDMLHNRSDEDNLKALQDEASRLLQLESDLALREREGLVREHFRAARVVLVRCLEVLSTS